jgi:large subunit ribosomal protein L18
MSTIVRTDIRTRVKRRIRARVSGTAERPRLSVYRSNKYMYVQAIDDVRGVTLASASDMDIKKGSKAERAVAVGTAVAQALLAKNITHVVFDRNGFKYTGRIMALADAARQAGLAF